MNHACQSHIASTSLYIFFRDSQHYNTIISSISGNLTPSLAPRLPQSRPQGTQGQPMNSRTIVNIPNIAKKRLKRSGSGRKHNKRITSRTFCATRQYKLTMYKLFSFSCFVFHVLTYLFALHVSIYEWNLQTTKLLNASERTQSSSQSAYMTYQVVAKAMSTTNWRSRLANMLREKTKLKEDDTGDKYVLGYLVMIRVMQLRTQGV